MRRRGAIILLSSNILGRKIVKIGNYAFNGTGLKSVTIPSSIKSIGVGAFISCSNLSSIIIEENVKEIPDKAFFSCTSLISITSKAVTPPVMGESVFSDETYTMASLTVPEGSVDAYKTAKTWKEFFKTIDCDGLCFLPTSDTEVAVVAKYPKYSGSVVIPAQITVDGISYAVTSIAQNAFNSCDALTAVTIPSSVKSIGEYAFAYSNNLTTIVIPEESVTSIAPYTFYYCLSLKSISIPGSVKSIGDYAFMGCGFLASITIPNSVSELGEYAFAGSGLTSVTLPNTLTEIKDGVFYLCVKLAEVTIPNSVITIGSRAFEECSGLTTITLGEGVEMIWGWAFSLCSSLESIYCISSYPAMLMYGAFSDDIYSNATVYVPAGSVSTYKHMWSEFLNITEATGVEDVISSATEAAIVGYYNMRGVMSQEPWHGVNVVVYSDGSTRKIVCE